MKKRMLYLILTVCALSLLLCACGDMNGNSAAPAPGQNPDLNTVPDTTPVPTVPGVNGAPSVTPVPTEPGAEKGENPVAEAGRDAGNAARNAGEAVGDAVGGVIEGTADMLTDNGDGTVRDTDGIITDADSGRTPPAKPVN